MEEKHKTDLAYIYALTRRTLNIRAIVKRLEHMDARNMLANTRG